MPKLQKPFHQFNYGVLFQHHTIMEAIGWVVLSIGTILSVQGYLGGREIGYFSFFLLVIGLWLVVRERDFWGMSDSAKKLNHEERSLRSTSAVHIHEPKHQVRLRYDQVGFFDLFRMNLKEGVIQSVVFLLLTFVFTTFLVSLEGNQFIQSILVFILSLFVLGFVVIRKKTESIKLFGVFLVFLVLALSSDFWFGAVGCVVMATIITLISLRHEAWKIFSFTVLAFYLSILRWVFFFVESGDVFKLQPVERWVTQWAFLSVFGLIMSILFVFPFIMKRRRVAHKEIIKGIFIINYLGLLVLSAYLVQPILSQRSLSSYFGSLIMIIFSLGVIAWMAYGRYSYAKYFYGIALAMAILAGLLSFDIFFVTVWVISIAVIVLTVGFALGSYSARLLGYFLTVVGSAHYLFNVIPLSKNSADPQEIYSIIFLGIFFVIQLLVLGHWIKALPKEAPEKEYGDWLYNAIYIMVYIMLISLINVFFLDYAVSFLWFVLAMVSYLVGYLKKNSALMLLAQVTVVIALLKIIYFDMLNASLLVKLGLPALIAVSGFILTIVRVENNKLTLKKRK